MKNLKITLALTLLFSASTTILAGGWSSPGSTGDTIERFYFNSGFTQVQLSAHNENPDNCSANSWYGLDTNNPDYDKIYSILLAAQLSRAKVRFWVHGCSGQGGNYPNIVSIMMDY